MANTAKDEFALLGNAGLALELAEYMLSDDKTVVGYYANSPSNDLNEIIPYLGDWSKTFSRSLKYIVAAGSIEWRKKFIKFIETNDLEAGSYISSLARLSRLASIGKGAVLTPGSGITGNGCAGDWLLINGGAIGHHAIVGNNVVVGCNSLVAGHCIVGNDVSLGTNSALLPGTVVGDGADIGILTYPPLKVAPGARYLSMRGIEM